MSGVTKERHLEILNAAKSALEAVGGTIKTDAMTIEERKTLLRDMERLIRDMANCHIDTAKRNLAKAMRQDRYRRMQEKENLPSWGGERPNAGRPRKEK